MALSELQEFKDCEKSQNKHHKKRHKKRHALFHSQWKGIGYSLFNNSDVFRDVFCDVYLRSFKVLHFRRGHVVMEAPIKSGSHLS